MKKCIKLQWKGCQVRQQCPVMELTRKCYNNYNYFLERLSSPFSTVDLDDDEVSGSSTKLDNDEVSGSSSKRAKTNKSICFSLLGLVLQIPPIKAMCPIPLVMETKKYCRVSVVEVI